MDQDGAWTEVAQEILGELGVFASGSLSKEAYDRRAKRLQEVRREVHASLRGHPKVTEHLKAELALGSPDDAPRAVADALVGARHAQDVVQALNQADYDLAKAQAAAQDRLAVEDILRAVLPIAVDWEATIALGRGFFSERNWGDLPLCTEAIAEIVLSGIEERHCHFTLPSACGPAGATLLRPPAEAYAPLYDGDGKRFSEGLVTCLADALLIERGRFEKRLGLLQARLLYRAKLAPRQTRAFHYIFFDNEEAREEQWCIARDTIGSTLPSLRLMRATGNAYEAEGSIADALGEFLSRPGRS